MSSAIVALTAIALALRILSNPVANVFQKKLTGKGYHALMVNFSAYALLSVPCAVMALCTDWSQVQPMYWVWAVVAGVIGSVGNGFLVMALKDGDLSILGPINSYKSVVGLIFGIIILGEMPSWLGLLGTVVIIGGSYFVFETTPEGFSWRLLHNKQIRYRIYAMVLTAIEAVFIKKVIACSSSTVAFYAWCWFGALFAAVQMLVMRVDLKAGTARPRKADAWPFLAVALCLGTMQFTTNYVFAHMNVSYGLALFQLSTIVSIVLGYKLFQERDIKRKLLGSVIMIAGSVMIIFG